MRWPSFDAEVVFNAAAYNQVDVAEKEPQAAFQVNALAVRNLALACRQVDAQLVHFSTDYVFDGTARHPYVEEDPTHPLGAYAVSKLAGELYAQAYLDRALVVRTSGVFGPGGLTTARGNFVELMLRLAASPNPIRVVEDHFASPTFAPLLASRTIDLVERNLSGLFHVGGGAPTFLVSVRPPDFRSRGPRPRPAGHQRARIPHCGAAAQVLGALQRQDGARRPGADAVAARRSSRLLRRPSGPRRTSKRTDPLRTRLAASYFV